MEIKRKKEIFIETRRRILVRLPEAPEKIPCSVCADDAPMISAEHAAACFGVRRREIYRLVETVPAIHYAETEAGVLFVCPNFLSQILSDMNLQIKREI